MESTTENFILAWLAENTRDRRFRAVPISEDNPLGHDGHFCSSQITREEAIALAKALDARAEVRFLEELAEIS